MDDCGVVQPRPPPLSLWQGRAPWRLSGPGSWLGSRGSAGATASPALPVLLVLGTDVLHRGEAPEPEGVDSNEYQGRVGPSSYLQHLSPQAVVDLEEGEQSRKRNK